MKLLLGLIGYPLIFLSLVVAEPVDWFEIADNTDAPAIGGKVVKINDNSFAQNQNFQEGDLISIMNDGYYGFDKKLPEDPYEIQIYSQTEGTTRRLTTRGGPMGITVSFFCHPWISFLREEIGVRGPWDEKLVELMVKLFGAGGASSEEWQSILDAGYPEDDALFDLIELAFDWEKGKTIQPYYFFTKWESELSPMPHTIFHLLERIALTCNDRRLLKALVDLNRDNMRISQSDLDNILGKGKGMQSNNGTEFFDYVNSIKGHRIEKVMRDVGQYNHKRIINRKTASVENGRYLSYWFLRPKNHKGRQFHFHAKFRAVGKPISSNYAASIRMAAYRYDHQAKKSGKLIGKMTLLGYKSGGSRVDCQGDQLSYLMKIRNAPPIPTNVVGKTALDIKNSPLVTMDLVLLNDQCAVYLDGKAMGHWPVSDITDDVCLNFYVSGVEAHFQDFAIWGLRSQ